MCNICLAGEISTFQSSVAYKTWKKNCSMCDSLPVIAFGREFESLSAAQAIWWPQNQPNIFKI